MTYPVTIFFPHHWRWDQIWAWFDSRPELDFVYWEHDGGALCWLNE